MSAKTRSFYQFNKLEASKRKPKIYANLLSGIPLSEKVDIYSYEDYLPLKLLNDCVQEIYQARESGDERPEWSEIYDLIDRAREQWSAEDLARSCEAFFLLGQVCGELSMPSREEYLEGSNARAAQAKRELPLVKKNIAAASCRRAMQEVAKLEWEQDISKSVRISDMCETIWSKAMRYSRLPDDMRDALPDKPGGLRSWLRPIAPDYAKIPGAPKKK